jgi:hypothetical protein
MEATLKEVIEKPVTGLAGRTPRAQFEMPRTSKNKKGKEVRLFLDVSGSEQELASPDLDLTKAQVIENSLPIIVGRIAKYDSKMVDEQSGGSPAKGGVLTFAFSYEGAYEGFNKDEAKFEDERFLGDISEANSPEKMARIHALIEMGCTTNIVPALDAAKLAYETEFPNGDEDTAIVDLVITDGKVSDHKKFENWLDDNAGPSHVIVVVIIGYGPGAQDAKKHYDQIADDNRYLTVVWLPGVVNPDEIATDVELACGLIAA